MMVIKLIARSALLVSVVMLTGCASQKTWISNKDVSSSEFNADKQYCNSLATASVGYRPPPVYRQAPIVSPTAYNINCNQYGYSANCNVRADQSAQLMADIRTQAENAGIQTGHGLAMLADSIRTEKIYTDCMQSKGYELVSNEELQEKRLKIQNSVNRWGDKLTLWVEKWKSFCSQEGNKDILKKTPCNARDTTLEQLSDKGYITETEKTKLLDLDAFSRTMSDERLQAANEIIEPMPLKESVVAFYKEDRIIFRELRQNLYSGKISWGEYNTKRMELANSRGEIYRNLFSKY